MYWQNEVRGIVNAMLARIGVPRMGTVVAVNPAVPTVTVLYQPDGVQSGPLPVKCGAAGAMNVIALPSVGDQVQIHPDNGNMEHGVVSAAIHSTQKGVPTSPVTGKPPQSGEYWINCGAVSIHVCNGNVYISGGNLVVNGNITATGNITAGQGTGDQVDMQGHDHQVPNVQTGSSTITTTAPVAGS